MRANPRLLQALAFSTTAWLASYAQTSPSPDAFVQDAVVETESPTTDVSPSEYVVLLKAPSLAAAVADARAQGRVMTPEEQRRYAAQLRSAHDALSQQLSAAGATEITRAGKAVNAIFVIADAATANRIAGIGGVRSVQAVVDFQRHSVPVEEYKEVTPHIGAASLRHSGVDGRGVRVAVLDSGIDYTHAAFGGAGTAEAFFAAYGRSQLHEENRLPVAWPQGRVMGGFDFVGERWPNGPLQPDPDPIAAPSANNSLGFVGTDGSHGTSVADILAGGPFAERPDNHGVAPGASLYAVKVCSAVSTSCSGIAMVQGIEWALDPNGDDSIDDAVDVINMSLGANFGQRENPAAEAAANAVRVGVIVCAAAGNAGDNPYIVSSPASVPEVISVAQTSMPRSRTYRIDFTSSVGVNSNIALTASLPWAPVRGNVSGVLARPADPLACGLLPDGSLSSTVALVDRGNCNVSDKVAYAQAAGAVAVIIANNVPGDPPSFINSAPPPGLPPDFQITIPALVISQADGNFLKSRLAAGETLTMFFSETAFTDMSSTIVTTSSRGPTMTTNLMKPEVGAPGASLAAVAGAGTGFEAFGGTSGATPVVAGVAALLRQQYPGISPLEAKARIMNNAYADIFQNRVTQPGVRTPISRAGAGEVRADAALAARASAWVVGANGAPSVPALSFGYWRLSSQQSFTQIVRVKNETAQDRSFSISSHVRHAPGDPGAVVLVAPPSIHVPAQSSAEFAVTLTVDPAKLRNWNTNSGTFGADGTLLASHEYSGFLRLEDALDTLQLPWHILPHRAHRGVVSASSYTLGSGAPLLSNSASSIDAVATVYALTGTSPRLRAGSYAAPGENFAVTDIQNVGVRLVDFGATIGLGLEFAITTWDRHTHANYPAMFQVLLDVNDDGRTDWIVFNQRVSSTTPDWRNAVYLQGSGWSVAYGTYFTHTDFNSANVVLQVPLSRIGQTVPTAPSPNAVANPIAPGQPIRFTVQAFDNYFTGLLSDSVGPMIYVPSSPRYVANGTLGTVAAAPGATTPIHITSTGVESSTSQSGLLLLFQHGRTRFESHAIRVTP
jgi:subtilisin family serine protease